MAKRLGLSGGHLGVAVGAGCWCAFAIWAYGWLVTSDFAAGPEYPVGDRANPVLDLLSISEPKVLAIAFLLPFSMVLLWCWIERGLRLDPEGQIRRSLWWGLKNGTLPTLVIIGLTGLTGLLFSLASHRGDFGILLPQIGFFLSAEPLLTYGPLLFLRPSVVAYDRAQDWWRLQWPGCLPLVTVSCLVALDWLWGQLATVIHSSVDGLLVPLMIASVLLETLLEVGIVAALIYRLAPQEFLGKIRSTAPSRLSPFVAQSILLFVGFALVLLPAALAVSLYEPLNSMRLWHATNGTEASTLVNWFSAWNLLLGTYLLTVTAPLLSGIGWFSIGRLIWLREPWSTNSPVDRPTNHLVKGNLG